MKLRFAVLIVAALLAGPGVACAQFSQPTLTLRTGAFEAKSSGGLAPYTEVQVAANVGRTPLGLALYGAASYARRDKPYRICPVAPPCFETVAEMNFFDLATGLRLGWLPPEGPVHVFAGFAAHVALHEELSGGSAGAPWPRYGTLELGASVRLPLTDRLSAEAGALGFAPVFVRNMGDELRHLRYKDVRRYGLILGLHHDL